MDRLAGDKKQLSKAGATMAYTAANIRVLNSEEVDIRFSWARVGALAETYSRPAEWIARGLEACRRADVEPEYFIARYLQRNPDTPFNPIVDEAMREILIESRRTRRPYKTAP